MKDSIPLRWLAEAEARSVREIERLRRSESPPLDKSARIRRRLSLLDRLRRSAPRPACRHSADPDRVLVTILITDIADSTMLVAAVGDRRWRGLLDRHDEATRQLIRRFGGKEINNRGDGFLAMFDSPARAVRCAAAIAGAVARLGISVRSGVHIGEIQRKRSEISGIAVHITARIAAVAQPGEAFVSKTVRDLVVGSGLVFEDRGIHQLRGLPEEIHLYAFAEATS